MKNKGSCHCMESSDLQTTVTSQTQIWVESFIFLPVLTTFCSCCSSKVGSTKLWWWFQERAHPMEEGCRGVWNAPLPRKLAAMNRGVKHSFKKVNLYCSFVRFIKTSGNSWGKKGIIHKSMLKDWIITANCGIGSITGLLMATQFLNNICRELMGKQRNLSQLISTATRGHCWSKYKPLKPVSPHCWRNGLIRACFAGTRSCWSSEVFLFPALLCLAGVRAGEQGGRVGKCACGCAIYWKPLSFSGESIPNLSQEFVSCCPQFKAEICKSQGSY